MSAQRSLALDLLLEVFSPAVEPAFRARIVRSPVGSATRTFALQLNPADLEKIYALFGRAGKTSFAGAQDVAALARQVGEQLFRSVFAGEVYTAFRSSLEIARGQNKPLTILLRIPNDATSYELVNLPWELMHDGTEYLSLSPRTPVVRFLEYSQGTSSIQVQPPLRALVIISNPDDYEKLNAAAEWQRMRDALADVEATGLFQMELLERPTLRDIQRRLRVQEFHILHFIGHGDFDPKSQSGTLVLEDEQGLGHAIDADRIGRLLTDHTSLRFVVLTACESGRPLERNVFAGVAQNLVRHIPAVLAMQFAITDRAVQLFVGELYRAIAEGSAIDTAVSDARKALYLEGYPLEWITPVFYARSEENHIFDLGALSGQEQKRLRVAGLSRRAQIALAEDDHGLTFKYAQELESLGEREAARKLRVEAERVKNCIAWYEQGKTHMDAEQWSDALYNFRQVQAYRMQYRDVSAMAARAESRVLLSEPIAPALNDAYEDDFALMMNAFMEGRVVPVLGMGVNFVERPSGASWKNSKHAPTPEEIIEFLTVRTPSSSRTAMNLVNISQYITELSSVRVLYERLHSVFDRDFLPTAVHLFLATLPAMARMLGPVLRYPIIISINYDDILERTFRAAEEPFDLVTYIAEGPDWGKFRHTNHNGDSVIVQNPNEYTELDQRARVIILKLHGVVNREDVEQDSFVVTEDHYINYLAQSTLSNIIPKEIMRPLKHSHFLFMGVTLRDWNLRGLLQRIWDGRQNRDYPSYTVGAQVSSLEKKMWQRRNVDLLEIPLNFFVSEMAKRLRQSASKES